MISGAGAMGHVPPTFGSTRARGGAPTNVNCYYYVIANVNNKHAINFADADFAGNCHILSYSLELLRRSVLELEMTLFAIYKSLIVFLLLASRMTS